MAEENFCLSSETKCDGHLNCGAVGQYDEDSITCGGIHNVRVSKNITYMLIISRSLNFIIL